MVVRAVAQHNDGAAVGGDFDAVDVIAIAVDAPVGRVGQFAAVHVEGRGVVGRLGCRDDAQCHLVFRA
ncbi:hypothetical protein D3C71_2057140 [compost metagenome]